MQPKVGSDLYYIRQAGTRQGGDKAFDHLQKKYKAKSLNWDREVLPTFYGFPAEHWVHLRTTNLIGSSFAIIRMRHRRTKGSGTRRIGLAMVFKLAELP